MGPPLDVTERQSTACAEPFVISIAFDEGRGPGPADINHLSLEYSERDRLSLVLGRIGLRPRGKISATGVELHLFEARSSSNYCLPLRYLGAHYLLQAYAIRRRANVTDTKMSFLERRASIVTFIRPHPVALVSLIGAAGGNIFPMNLMGSLGNGRFGFALKVSRTPSHLVERAGRVALSSVPMPRSALVFELAANHFKESIDWSRLSFSTRPSATFHIPVPEFALRVRELEIESVHGIGSHKFFVAKIVSDLSFADGPVLCTIHGFFQAWRLKGRPTELRAALAEDWLNKHGSPLDL
jgi:flavin reductase (DIM6/NTAB) family NADH-FMN oxidoreductase RutF